MPADDERRRSATPDVGEFSDGVERWDADAYARVPQGALSFAALQPERIVDGWPARSPGALNSAAIREILEDANAAVRNVCFGHIDARYFDGDKWAEYPGGVVPLDERRRRYERLREQLVCDIGRAAPRVGADEIRRHLDAVWDVAQLEQINRAGRAAIERDPARGPAGRSDASTEGGAREEDPES